MILNRIMIPSVPALSKKKPNEPNYGLHAMYERFYSLRNSTSTRPTNSSDCALLIAFFMELRYCCAQTKRIRQLMVRVERLINSYLG